MTPKITPGIWTTKTVRFRVYYKRNKGYPLNQASRFVPDLDRLPIRKISPIQFLEWNDDKTYSVKL